MSAIGEAAKNSQRSDGSWGQRHAVRCGYSDDEQAGAMIERVIAEQGQRYYRHSDHQRARLKPFNNRYGGELSVERWAVGAGHTPRRKR